MNRSASFDTCEHFGVSDERCCYVRDANGQIVFSYGSRESEACVDSNYISWEEKVDQVIEFTGCLLKRFYDTEYQPNGSLITVSTFLTNIISSTNISISTIITALVLINRLKTLNPNCRGSGSSGHRLLLAAILLASKLTTDVTYDNKSWAHASAGMFDLDQVNKMEMEFLAFIDYQVFVSPLEWSSFADNIVKRK